MSASKINHMDKVISSVVEAHDEDDDDENNEENQCKS